MSDDDWDADDMVTPVGAAVPRVPVASKWDDEDADDDNVKDSWDASDDDEGTDAKKPDTVSTQPSTTKPQPAKSKKKSLSQKIAERREEEERKHREMAEKIKAVQEADAKGGDDGADFADETPQQRRERLAKSVVQSDFENAKALFGDLAISGGIPPSQGEIESQTPTTRGEFDDFVKLVMKKFATFEKLPQYTYFVETLLRDLVVSMSVEDTRRISSSLNAMINEKQRVAREAQAKGKKKPGAAGAAKQSIKAGKGGDVETQNYDNYDDYDDFDDFM